MANSNAMGFIKNSRQQMASPYGGNSMNFGPMFEEKPAGTSNSFVFMEETTSISGNTDVETDREPGGPINSFWQRITGDF